MIFVLSNNRKQLFLIAKSKEEAFRRIDQTINKHPDQAKKYIECGYKLIEAASLAEAKDKFEFISSITKNGEYSLFP